MDLRDSKAIEIAKLREETELLHQKIQHQEVLNSSKCRGVKYFKKTPKTWKYKHITTHAHKHITDAALRNRNLYKEIEQRLDQGKLESSDQQNDKVKEK